MIEFQYQPLCEGLPGMAKHPADSLISIPALLRGASGAVPSMVSTTVFQYQPLCEGLRKNHNRTEYRLHISIPAPLRGASSREDISGLVQIFQYQPLCEGLLSGAYALGTGCAISIPAPLRGASKEGSAERMVVKYFNTSPSARGFDSDAEGEDAVLKFQYQPLCEGLRRLNRRVTIMQRFQYQPLCEGLQGAASG